MSNKLNKFIGTNYSRLGIHLMVKLMVKNELNWPCPDTTSQLKQCLSLSLQIPAEYQKWAYMCAEYLILFW